MEVETLPIHHFTFLAGFAYVDLRPSSEAGSEDIYTYNLGLRYDDRGSFRAELFGHYIWWDFDGVLGAEYDDFI